MLTNLEYEVTKGLDWERLVVVKNRSTRRVIKPSNAWATAKLDDVTTKSITCSLLSDGGILLYMSSAETAALAVGTYPFDVVATVPNSTLSTSASAGTENVPVASGTITVIDLNLISSLTP